VQAIGSGGEQRHVASSAERGDAGIKRHTTRMPVAARERHKLGMGHLPVADEGWDVRVGERNVADQE